MTDYARAVDRLTDAEARKARETAKEEAARNGN